MARLLMFAGIRHAAGTNRAVFDGATVETVLKNATQQFGAEFAKALPYCMVLVDDEQAEYTSVVNETSEIALLPPVSGGAE